MKINILDAPNCSPIYRINDIKSKPKGNIFEMKFHMYEYHSKRFNKYLNITKYINKNTKFYYISSVSNIKNTNFIIFSNKNELDYNSELKILLNNETYSLSNKLSYNDLIDNFNKAHEAKFKQLAFYNSQFKGVSFMNYQSYGVYDEISGYGLIVIDNFRKLMPLFSQSNIDLYINPLDMITNSDNNQNMSNNDIL